MGLAKPDPHSIDSPWVIYQQGGWFPMPELAGEVFHQDIWHLPLKGEWQNIWMRLINI